jgi:hypothetical protein
MKLMFGFAAKSRVFAKALQRVMPTFDSLRFEFERVELLDPIHSSILVGITDDKPAEFFEEIQNNSGVFQVLVGCPYVANDQELKRVVFERLRMAVVACPFSTPDKNNFDRLLHKWACENINGQQTP